ncbi:MAG: carbon-nitrogen hydrolase family protein [Firmicutes bacterium]|nr:carbon-nitrogen hydrolase family protein [Bacillota bacterium]
MLVAALSLAGVDLSSINGYISGLINLLTAQKPVVAVLPAHSALALGLGVGRLNSSNTFQEASAYYFAEGTEWTSEFLNLHGLLAKELQIYLVTGNVIEKDEDLSYQTCYCLNPAGQVCCAQRQTHLTRFEQDLHLSRGDKLDLFRVGNFYTGLVIGNDARHPEVGRIMALQGADLLLHSGAIEGDQTCWQQAAGMWAQVQQNQLYAVEAQLSATIANTVFGGNPSIIAPCETTFGNTGYLARCNPGEPLLCAELDKETLSEIRNDNPLLKLLNFDAYTEICGSEPQ